MDGQIQPIVDITLDNQDLEIIPFELVTFPNPFTETVNFKFLLTSGGNFNLTINDLTGKTIYEQNEYLSEGIHQIPVNISEYYTGKGVLLYQITVDGRLRKSGKLIK
jgi:hypothetical protein